MPRTALIVPVPEAEPFVGEVRSAHDWSAVRGVPAHVTVLFPFADAAEVDEEAIADVLADHPAFDFELESIGRFPEHVTYLAPVPAAPFSALTAAVFARFPDCPPYEGLHEEVVPHLTVADAHIPLELDLPIAARAREVLLIEETEPGGQWVTRRSFALR